MNNEKKEFFFPNEPLIWTDNDKALVRDFFIWVAENKGNDINITSNSQISIQKDGEIYRATKRDITNNDVEQILFILNGLSKTALTRVLQGEAADFAYEVRSNDKKQYRFRVNVVQVYTRGSNGLQITARIISSVPPKYTDLAMEQEIIDACDADEGMVIFTGSTGTGKSTSMAAIIRKILEDPKNHKKIVTYEAPIEYVYENIISPHCIVSQSEIPSHLPNFVKAIESALRRAPDIILIGESRDAETIGQSIVASQSGHLLFTTAHTNGVAETIKRMINAFSAEERNSKAQDIIASLKIIVSQKLVPRVGGGRVALREYLVFNQDIKEELQLCDLNALSYHCRQLLINHGQTFLKAAQIAFDKGLISEETYNRQKNFDKSIEKDAKISKPITKE